MRKQRLKALLWWAALLGAAASAGTSLAQNVEVSAFPGRRAATKVFDDVAVAGAKDTSDWVPVGRYHFFTVFFDLDPATGQSYFASADSLPDFELRYELWYGGIAEEPSTSAQPFWEKGQSQAKALMTFNAATDTLNGGRFYEDFHQPGNDGTAGVSPTAWVRFVLVPGAANDRSTGYRASVWLLRQP